MILSLGATILGKFGLGASLAKRFAWVPLVIAALLVLAFIYWIATSWFDTAIDTAKDAGTTEAVVAGQNQTLDQLGDANVAEQNLRTGGERSAERYAGCLLDSRNKDRCERYNPDTGQ